MQTFPYPVGLAVFNRPTYHQALFESFMHQSLPVDMALVVAHLDSYEGSRDQSVGRADFTRTTSEFIGQYWDLPESQVIRAPHNRGVARSLTALERALFAASDARWALVIEGNIGGLWSTADCAKGEDCGACWRVRAEQYLCRWANSGSAWLWGFEWSWDWYGVAAIDACESLLDSVGDLCEAGSSAEQALTSQ